MTTESKMPSNPLILCSSLLLLPQSFPASGSCLLSQPFVSDGQSIGTSAILLPINIQGWFPLGLTGLIFLPKGLSSLLQHHNWKHQFFSAQTFLLANLNLLMLMGKTRALTMWTFVSKGISLLFKYVAYVCHIFSVYKKIIFLRSAYR